jgi:hypothetical protein
MANAKLVNLDRARTMAEVEPLANSAESCARAILRGVRRNQSLVVVTGHAKLMHFLQRFAPWAVRLIARNAAKTTRVRCRTAPLA